MKTTLRWGILCLGLLAAAPAASAAPGAPGAIPAAAQKKDDELRVKYAEKLEKEFVSKIEWIQSFEQARASAKKQGKLVLGYFTRSYAP